MDIKTRVKIFKALGNEGRLKILKLLADKKERTVSDITKHIGISFKSTSKHLIILDNLGFVQNSGKKARVFYSISGQMYSKIKEMVRREL